MSTDGIVEVIVPLGIVKLHRWEIGACCLMRVGRVVSPANEPDYNPPGKKEESRRLLRRFS